MQRISIELFVNAGIGVLVALLGPFGTYQSAPGKLMFYWISLIIVGYVIFRPLLIVSRWLHEVTRIPLWTAQGLAIGLASLPVTLLVATTLNGFHYSSALKRTELPTLYSEVLLIGVLANLIFNRIFVQSKKHNEIIPVKIEVVADVNLKPLPPPTIQISSRFHARLSIGFGALLALKSEDHYVRAYSITHEVLILIRLRDAIAELDDTDGLHVYRSWWGARIAVKERRRGPRSLSLTLVNGVQVPVSREGTRLLKSFNWI